MRKEIVKYLRSIPHDSDSFPPLGIWQMTSSLAGTYGNQITLHAAANLYNVDIQIVSSPGVGVSAATVYLGHFAENQEEHYVSLEQVTDHNYGIEKEYEANDPGEGEISEYYANKMHMEQDVVDFEMGDTDAKSGPDSIVGIGDKRD